MEGQPKCVRDTGGIITHSGIKNFVTQIKRTILWTIFTRHVQIHAYYNSF